MTLTLTQTLILIEARLRLPDAARGSWPAVWMLPEGGGCYGGWPKSGEIDIMEHVGMDPGRVHGTVHTDRFNHMKGTQVGKAIDIDVSEWHTFGVDWRQDSISFLVDNHVYHSFSLRQGGGSESWPFDQPFHLILNVAVGGAWGGQRGVDEAAFGRGASGQGGQVMEVDWVRIYRPRESSARSPLR